MRFEFHNISYNLKAEIDAFNCVSSKRYWVNFDLKNNKMTNEYKALAEAAAQVVNGVKDCWR